MANDLFSIPHVFNNLSGREHLRDELTGVGQDMELPRSVEGKWGPVLRVVEQTMHEGAEAKVHFDVVLGFHIGVIRGFDVDVNIDRPSMSSGSAFGERRDPHSAEQSDRRRRGDASVSRDGRLGLAGGGADIAGHVLWDRALNEGDNVKNRDVAMHHSALLEASCFLCASASPPAESSASATGGPSPPPSEQFARSDYRAVGHRPSQRWSSRLRESDRVQPFAGWGESVKQRTSTSLMMGGSKTDSEAKRHLIEIKDGS
ncbi:hypothetical protein GGG16DRAFT_102966 [Schizophyllum commune]